jgi:hypothetical protein
MPRSSTENGNPVENGKRKLVDSPLTEQEIRVELEMVSRTSPELDRRIRLLGSEREVGQGVDDLVGLEVLRQLSGP